MEQGPDKRVGTCNLATQVKSVVPHLITAPLDPFPFHHPSHLASMIRINPSGQGCPNQWSCSVVLVRKRALRSIRISDSRLQTQMCAWASLLSTPEPCRNLLEHPLHTKRGGTQPRAEEVGNGLCERDDERHKEMEECHANSLEADRDPWASISRMEIPTFKEEPVISCRILSDQDDIRPAGCEGW